LMNQLMKDPEIRCKFEFWTYEYPTGAPIPYLALHLREDIETMQKFRRSRGATCSDVIMIGHSMGGLMSKTLTQRSGDAQWNRFFELPVDQLDVPNEERELLKKMFYFEPVPCVKRVIFTATPHSGADAVDRSFVRIAEQFIQTPRILVGATRNILHQSAHALTPLGVEISHDFPNSIEHMRYGSEMGDIFADIPLNSRVKYHSLMGSKKGLDVPKDEMTDGIVSYNSAHIDGVESEKIIASDHGVQRNPAGIAEIARILKSAR
ncbi:MAG: hypothetical protein P1V20_24220, partial [Verrucomicrobiales bacterium]|nr:hypothetical protein [Verrucomicrobiales bacterium]